MKTYKDLNVINHPNFMIYGGARGKLDFDQCKKNKLVSACVAGSSFVFQGKYDSVLINYNI